MAWARRHDAAIVEDDGDSEFRFRGHPIEPLHRLDDSGRVLYVGWRRRRLWDRSEDLALPRAGSRPFR